ncbi:MAG: hypothetical protein R3F35_09925 [Myxococcota bacterium]
MEARTPAEPASAAPRGLPRLELKVERLQLRFRFTFAFHAREVRFEVSRGSDGFERVFPETFCFHAPQHDPTELSLQLEDLLSKPRLLGPRATARDARNLVVRLLSSAPRHLEALFREIDDGRRLQDDRRLRFHQDLALLSQVFLRFIETHELDGGRPLRLAAFALRRRIYESLRELVAGRVDPDYVERYVAGAVQLVETTDDPTESGFFQTLETGEREAADRLILRMAERAFYLWVEGVCLDEENQAFEKEDTPFGDRESEIIAAIAVRGATRIERGRDLVPYLRRRDRNTQRIFGKLERWFLRAYDIRNASAIINYGAALTAGRARANRALTWHTPGIHALTLAALAAPFVVGIFAYERFPRAIDLVCSAEVLLVNASALWFLLYRFCWKRDLSFFHSSVPRIGAGIIVGYLPVFLIDEVWDLASHSTFALNAVSALLGLVTLLYIYVEIAHRIPDPSVAFARARAIFLLGVVEAFGAGIVMTSLVGPFMVERNWSPDSGTVPLDTLKATMPSILGQLPHLVGYEPLWVFPSALFLMTFLSFFIGIFLQLMWEELPITEPL